MAAPSRPNIVVIMTDDQTVESMRVLPKTLQLVGAAGTTFSRAIVSYPLCCPSRATYLTGQHAHNHRVLNNARGFDRVDHSNTLPVWLRAAGYYTAHVGKYLNGYDDSSGVPAGYDSWFALGSQGYRMYDYHVNDNGRIVAYGSSPAHYQTDVLARRAVQIIRARESGTPFYLTVWPLAPHDEILDQPTPPRPAPRHAGRYQAVPLPRPPSFNEADVSDKPAIIRSQPRFTPTVVDDITRRYRAQLAALLAVDDLVASVMGALRDTGQLDRTLVVFTSDNGFLNGQHRLAAEKVFGYEESIRVPLLIRGGGFPAGRTTSALVSNVDLPRTLVAVSGARPRRLLDGRPLLPLPASRPILLETGHNEGKAQYVGVRTDRYVYLQHNTAERELYDLARDPHQLDSRHADPAYAAVRAQLARDVARLRSCRGATCNPPQ